MNFKQIVFNVFILFSYCVVGFALNFVLKNLTKVYIFPFPVVTFLMQAVGIFIISTLVLKKRDKDTEMTVSRRLMDNIGEIKVTGVLSLFYILNGICSISALNFNSIPIYLAGRRCMVLFAVFVKVISGQSEKVTKSMVIASIVISSSALVAMQGDIMNGTLIGYFILFCADLFSVLYSEISGILQNKNKKDSIVLLQQNTMNSILPILLIAYLKGELYSSMNNFMNSFYQMEIIFCLALMSITIFLHQLCLFMASKYTSPFAIVLAGNFKDVFATVISLLLFKDVNLSPQVKLSLMVSFAGSFGYCISKYYEEKAKEKKIKEKIDQEDHSYVNIQLNSENNHTPNNLDLFNSDRNSDQEQ